MQSREVFGLSSQESGDQNAKIKISISQAITNTHRKLSLGSACVGTSTSNVINSTFFDFFKIFVVDQHRACLWIKKEEWTDDSEDCRY